MKAFFIGLWVIVVTLSATYGAAMYSPSRTKATASADTAVLQHQKTRVLNVPMVADGAVQGFITVQFDFTADGSVLKALQVPPEIFLLDEAFRTIYADKSLDFRNLKTFDIGGLTHHLVESTNARLGAPLIKDVLIVDFSYIPKDSAATP